MKRILEISIYKPGDLTSEVITLADVNSQVDEDSAVFTGHATVKSQFKGKGFSGFYQLSKEYAKQQGRWEVITSRTARVAENQAEASYVVLEQTPEIKSAPSRAGSTLQQTKEQYMSYIRKSLSNVLAAMSVVIAAAAIAVWQFYQFATYSDARGIVDVQGGAHHLWWAIGRALFACLAGYFVFSVFLRQEKEDVIHITA
jgi:hypothetical protein